MKTSATLQIIILSLLILFVCIGYVFWIGYTLNDDEVHPYVTAGLMLLMALVICFFLIRKEIQHSQLTKVRLKQDSLLLANISDAVVTTDEHFIITGWNRYAEELYGWKSSEAIGQKYFELLKTGYAYGKDEMQQLYFSNGFINSEAVHYQKDNAAVDVWISSRLYNKDDGSFGGTVTVARNISHIKKLEEQVRIKDKELATVFARITDGIVAIDKEWRYKYVNKAAGMLLGKSPEQLVGRTLWDMFPEAEKSSYGVILLQAMTEEVNKEYETYYEPLKKWFQVNVYADANGLSVIFKDITQPKQYEEELRIKSEEFSHIMESITDGYISLDENWNYRYANRRMGEITGANYKSLPGKNIWALFPHLKLLSFYQKAHQAMQQKFQSHYEEYVPHLEMWIENRIYPSDHGIVIFMRDITEKRAYEKKLKDHEEQLTLFIDHSPVPLAMFDINMKYLAFSRCYTRDFHLEPEAVTGMSIEDVFPQLPSPWFTAINNCLNGSIEKCEEELFTLNDHTREWIRWEMHPWYNSLGEIGGLIQFAEIISERKSSEDTIKASMQQLRELSDRMQTVREEERTAMAREIHDELGQQLTGLKMDVSWVNNRLKKTDPVLSGKLEETRLLIDETIKTVRRIATDLRPAILDDIGLSAAIEWQSREFEKRFAIHIHFSSTAEHVTIPGNITTALFRIFQESITNVLRHAAAKNVYVVLTLEHQVLSLDIRDDGKGFDLHQLSHKKTLGLLGMRERTITIGGKYELNSTPKAGTHLQVTVPLYIEKAV